MNQNNLSQPQMTPAMMNQLMAYLQAQSGIAPAGSSATHSHGGMASIPQIQQPPMWQGWQPQMTMNGSGMQQGQWVYPQFQSMPPQQAGLPQPPLADLAAAVAGALAPLLNNKERGGSTPDYEITSQDEQLLINRLKKWKARGLDPCQALGKLHNVNGHSEADWKDYFLHNLERLYPSIYPLTFGYESVRESASYSSQDRTRVTSRSDKPQHALPKRNGVNVSMKAGPGNTTDSPIPVASRASRTMNRAPDTPDRVSKPRARPVLVSESMHANRSRRGEPVGDYHDQTLIPPSDPTIKPMPPRTSDHTKFTDEDRIFFIHYLRWRLYDGEVPTKNELYEELATELPHHGADAWKKHWLNHCELPDKILVEATKREAEESESDQSGGSEEASVQDDESDSEEDIETKTNVTRPRRGRRSGWVRVTEEDLRAMAQYKGERLAEWDSFGTKKGAWVEFAARKENGHRSLLAWYTVSRDHAATLQRYLKEYLDERQNEETEAPASPALSYADEVPSTRPSGSSPWREHPEPQAQNQSLDARPYPSLPRKRTVEGDTDGIAHSPKRIKQDVETVL